MTDTSKYAPELRKRGLVPAVETEPAPDEEAVDLTDDEFIMTIMDMIRSEPGEGRRMMFMCIEGDVFAIDEQGIAWVGNKEVDLSDLGFIDIVGDLLTSPAIRMLHW